MLTRLHLTNFRRHVDTEIDLSHDAQIIAITGRNGAGKTSLLEAVTFALYGESRHGRRHLAKMVRRGAEHEGMQVELAFSVGDVDYEITRRWEKGKHSATLFANGNPTMGSPDGVSAEVTKVFGMDAVGFRLAVIAQQFDVDGLASLTPAVRQKTITRLLRQDAVTKAAKAARDEHNRQLEVIRTYGAGPDLAELDAELALAQAASDAAAAAASESRAALVLLDAELATTVADEQAWQAAQIAVARAEATAAAARAELDRLQAELAGVRIPDPVEAPDRTAADLATEISEVNVAIARGQAARELADTAAQTRADLDRVTSRLEDIATDLAGATPATLAMDLTKLSRQVSATETDIAAVREGQDATRGCWHEANNELRSLDAREAGAAGLADVCDTCEQAIPDSHKAAQAAKRAERKRELLTARDAAVEAGAAADKQIGALEQTLAGLRAEREQLLRRRGTIEALLKEREDLERRKTQYTSRLDRIVTEPVDLDALFAAKGVLECLKAQAEQAADVARAREAATARQSTLQLACGQAQQRLDAALSDIASSSPDADLQARHARRAELAEQRAEEAELVAALDVEAAASVERVSAVLRAQRSAAEQHARIHEHRQVADSAAKAARLLEDTATQMATLIRPALEGEISTLIQQLSEGRFTSVKVSDSYEITVLDDGKYEPLSELSGGERVLVALATRLALANVVAGRHASGGIGFLILDEVFGSQDSERREAILTGLRTLRAMYGQILLISHVGGMEEAADRVLDVSVCEDETGRTAEVHAA